MANKERVLITGVAGFLGSWLAEELLNRGYEVIGIDNLLGGEIENVPKGVRFIEGDSRDIDLMSKISKDVDVIYHLAAAPHEGLSVFSPKLVTEHTYVTSTAVYVAAIRNKVRRVIFTSSMARYGNNKIPFTEDMEPKPVDPYGVAKVASEKLFKIMNDVEGIDYIIAVPHNIIGPRQKFDDPYRNVVSIFINRMLQGKQPIIYGDGNQKRTFSDVQDCVEPLIKMMEDNIPSGEVINIGPGPDNNFITINKLAEIIADEIGFDLNPIYVGERPQEVKEATCSDEKARKLLGFKPRTDIKDTIRRMIDYIKDRGPKEFEYHLGLEIVNDKVPRTWKEKMM